jgi:hypothetical protein
MCVVVCACVRVWGGSLITSGTARSIAVFSMNAHASARLSAVATWIAWSTSCCVCGAPFISAGRLAIKRLRRWLPMLMRTGSLAVTMTRLPARWRT